MNTLRILVVEDEPKVGAFIREGLGEQGYQVDLATDGQMASGHFKNSAYQLVILDVLIPHISGVELCRQFRKTNGEVPILMLTALGTMEDKLAGFDAGADDYLVKPFEFQELLARIKALTKRTQQPTDSENILKVFDLELDLEKKKAIRGSNSISLTAKEFRLLEYLMRNKERVLSKEEISDKVWDVNFDTGTNFVEVYVNLLRKKIDKGYDPKLIHTRFGLGYCFTNQP